MSTEHSLTLDPTIADIQRQLSEWRHHHRPRARLPHSLWAAAAALCTRFPVSFVARELRQYNEDGSENTWKQLNPNEIVRVILRPRQLPMLPTHRVLIDRDRGVRFVRRFGRGFIKQTAQGFQLAGYLNCIVTTHFRFYALHTGECVITDKDYELYL